MLRGGVHGTSIWMPKEVVFQFGDEMGVEAIMGMVNVVLAQVFVEHHAALLGP